MSDTATSSGPPAASGSKEAAKPARSSKDKAAREKRPRDEKARADKHKREKSSRDKKKPRDPAKDAEFQPKKLIVKGPLGWDIEIKPEFHMPEPRLGPCLLPLPSLLPAVTKHEWCSLDAISNWKLHAEPNLGVYIDLIKGDSKPGDPLNVLPAEDEALFKSLEPLMGKEPSTVGQGDDAFEAGKARAKSAVWLKNTTYLSNNLHAPVHSFGSRATEKATIAAELAKVEVSDQGAHSAAAIAAQFEAAAALDAGGLGALKHATKPHLTATLCAPLAPDPDLWANNYVQVSVGDDPDFGTRGKVDAAGKPLPLDTDALVSQVCETRQRRRGQPVLSASYSTAAPSAGGANDAESATYAWHKQYQVNLKEEPGGGDRLALIVDEDASTATYCQLVGRRMELTKGRPTEAARGDKETPIDLDWNGKTVLSHERDEKHKAVGTTPAIRNDFREKMKELDYPGISDDEYVSSSGEEESDDDDAAAED